jgi:hypothetical protein
MNSAHRRTLALIFSRPTRSNIRWSDIESLIIGLGGRVEERAGSRVVIRLNGLVSVFHRPHPRPDTAKAAVDAMRVFLINADAAP